MKSKTSFFNLTVLKKDITRYSPIWASYTIILLLTLFGMSGTDPHIMADDVLFSLQPMAVLNLLYAGFCGAFLFMDLFNGRLCNALHAFPMRRESWLVTHITAGLLFSFIPNLLISLLGSLMMWEYAYIALIWLAVSTLQFLFFFGTAVLCAMCAGNLIGMAAVYGIFHFITVLIYALAGQLYEPLLHGVHLNEAGFFYFFPTSQLVGLNYANFELVHTNTSGYGIFHGLNGEAWLYLGLCAAAGIVSWVLAWFVYRRRQLESAGDLLSLRKLSPLFTLICTIGAGTFLYLFFDVFDSSSYVFLVIGMVIGYFACQMLLNRTVKVFHKKAFLRLGILVAVFFGSLLITWLDPIGITRYVPKLENIQSAAVIGGDKGRFYTESLFSYYDEGDEFFDYGITDAQELTQLQDFHRELMQYELTDIDDNGIVTNVNILYTLKNGRTVTRYYKVDHNSPLGQRAKEYFSNMGYIFEVENPAILYDSFASVALKTYTADGDITDVKLTNQTEIAKLLDAIKADCEAGVMAQDWAYHESDYQHWEKSFSYYLEFSVDDSIFEEEFTWRSNRIRLQVWHDCTNTMAYMQEMIDLSLPQD